MKEMQWENLKSGNSGDNLEYIKLQPGQTVVRVASMPVELEVHWESTGDGSKKKIVCPGVGCPICKAGHVPTKRFQALVFDRADGELKILEGGSSIFGQIKQFALDADYGNPTKYDVKIRKEGSGRETRYSVLASPNKSDLTPEEVAKLDSNKTLTEINAPKSVEEIMEMGLDVFNNTWADFDNQGSAANQPAQDNSGFGMSDNEFINNDWNNV